MYLIEKTLDDLMRKVYFELKDGPFDIESSRSDELGKLNEKFGVMLELTNPRARLSKTETRGKAFSALGELVWYLSGDESLEFIQFYIRKYEKESYDNKTIYGAYGPRLLISAGQYNQLQNVIDLLKNKRSSKRAVIQLFEARDIAPNRIDNIPSVPCTCTLQFLVRDNKVSLIVFMRSNDAYIGLQHDIFAFTMIQEIVAAEIGADLGTYKHCIGSLHLYENNQGVVQQYLNEGLMSTRHNMPPMPLFTAMASIKILIEVEKAIRLGNDYDIDSLKLDPYWKDLAYMLATYAERKKNSDDKSSPFKDKMSTKIYDIYLNK